MLSFGEYAAILFGGLVLLISIVFLVLFTLSLSNLSQLLETVFSFTQVRNLGDKYLLVDVCGDKFEIFQTIWSRFPFVSAVGSCILVSILVFIEGCIFSTRHVYSDKICSDRIPNCYLFRSSYTSFKPLYNFICESSKPVIPSNMSATYAVCYGFVLPDQSSMDILNQLGVCTAILSLVEFLYPLAYKFSRKSYGRICLFLLFSILLITGICVLSIQLNVSFMTIILLTLTEALIINIFVLNYRKMKYPANVTRVGSYIDLQNIV